MFLAPEPLESLQVKLDGLLEKVRFLWFSKSALGTRVNIETEKYRLPK